MTNEEELSLLEELVRRLKVEYDVYFGGGSRKAPTDLDYRVQSIIKKFSDSQKLSAQQRFHYNGIVQRYAIYSDLWRQKLKIKEEGFRRPQDALHGIQGLRSVAEEGQPQVPAQSAASAVLTFSGDESETIRKLYGVVGSARPGGSGSETLETFANFLRAKTKQIQAQHGCAGVKYTVQVKDGRLQIKARPNP